MKTTIQICKGICLLTLLAVAGSAQSSKKLSQAEAMAAVVSKTPPEFPVIARQLKIQGVVELEAVIGENGLVEAVNIVSGNPVLTKPAAEAVKKWKFAPQSVDGKPTRATAPVVVSFKL